MFVMQDETQHKPTASLKGAAVNIFLVVNALIWYMFFFSSLKSSAGCTGDDLVILVGSNLLILSLFAILSSVLIQKIKNRLKFLIYWMVTGVLLSPTLLLVSYSSFLGVIVISGIVGAYFGLGFPVFMGYYTATTRSANRAKTSGFTVFFVLLSFTMFALFIHGEVFTALTLLVWKLCGLGAILRLKPPEAAVNDEENISYVDVLKKRDVLLYFVPWLVFSMVNNFAFPVLYAAFESDFIVLITIAEGVLAGFFAICFGFLADRVGRRRLLFVGFTLLGLGYAILGLSPTVDGGLLFYTIVDGAAWGIFATLFLLTLWGDIADKHKRGSEKFFVIGFIPYLISSFLQLVFDQYFVSSTTNLITVFSFACFFLFLTFIPLYLATETLPPKNQAENIQEYVKKARKKIAESKKENVVKRFMKWLRTCFQ